MKKKYVLKNKRRFIIIIAVMVSIICSTLIFVTTRTKGYTEPMYQKIAMDLESRSTVGKKPAQKPRRKR